MRGNKFNFLELCNDTTPKRHQVMSRELLKLTGWTEVSFVEAAIALDAGHPVRQLWPDSDVIEESGGGIFVSYRCWISDDAYAEIEGTLATLPQPMTEQEL